MPGIPFIGENDFYPSWVKNRERWVFQRTLVSVGGLMAGYAEMAASQVSIADQVIVWVPRSTGLVGTLLNGTLHHECQAALSELVAFTLRCYGNDCPLTLSSTQHVQSVITEIGHRPARWRLQCPTCAGQVGPDLAPVATGSILSRWNSVGRPPLENPAASATFRSAAPISDLADWVQKNEPSHLELAYVGQQLWPDARTMLESMGAGA
jgi:hypothetical protein